MKKKNILVLSAGRADYHLLKNLIIELKKNIKFNTFFTITGTHLSKKYGSTIKEINQDKIRINKIIKTNLSSSSDISILNSINKITKNFYYFVKKNNINLLLLLGDRFEVFCAAYVCNILRIPIAHIHGGELTRGSYDDNWRHCITKLSSFHFVSTKIYQKRVIQMGEDPKYVFNVGSLGVENALKFKNKIKKNKKILEKQILVCYHSATNNIKKSRKDFISLLKALKNFKEFNIIFTAPNYDLDSDFIIKEINLFIKKNKNSRLEYSFGQENFFYYIQNSNFVIGNSSSGIIEVPSLNTPFINIGDRQKGRVQSKSTFNTNGNSKSIIKIIRKVITTDTFDFNNPYFKRNCSKNIIRILKNIDLNANAEKKFFDIKY